MSKSIFLTSYPLFLYLSLCIPVDLGFLRLPDLIILLSFFYFPLVSLVLGLKIKFFGLFSLIFLFIYGFLYFIILGNIFPSALVGVFRYLSLTCCFYLLLSIFSHKFFNQSFFLSGILRLTAFFAFSNVVYYSYQLIVLKFFGDYLFSTLFCEGATAYAGIQIFSVYLILLLARKLCSNLSNFELLIYRTSIIFLPILGFLTLSRSFIATFLIFTFINFFPSFFHFFKTFKFRSFRFSYSFLVFLIALLAICFSFSDSFFTFIDQNQSGFRYFARVFGAFDLAANSDYVQSGRLTVIQGELSNISNFIEFLIGKGVGAYDHIVTPNTLRVGMHSQFSRLFLDFGIPFSFLLLALPLFFAFSSSLSTLFPFLVFSVVLSFYIYFSSYDLLSISSGQVGFLLVFNLFSLKPINSFSSSLRTPLTNTFS